MKSCTYCGRENADESVTCRECGTTEFEVVEAVSAQPEAVSDSCEGAGEKTTDLPMSDAQKFLDMLQEEGVEFRLSPLDGEMREMDAFTASVGGGFGRAVCVRIYTRLEDDERVDRIWRAFCGFEK